MGIGYNVKCSKCNYHKEFFLGSGMLFPVTYEKVQKKIMKGEYGDEWKSFLERNPGAVFDGEKELYRCHKCNNLVEDYNLSLYLSKDGQPPEHGYWCNWGYHDKEYKFVKSYVHKCPTCSRRMAKLNPDVSTSIPCPKCSSDLIIDGSILWD